ncbi:MAG: class I SAM-dependent methyltransferase [Acidimicrobiales bacterium]
MTDLPDHAAENRRYWGAMADQWVGAGERSWAADQPTWGIWQLPEAELHLLPPDMTGIRAIELGCGTGYVSSWMARRGAEVVGIDITPEQLATARRLAEQHQVDLTLIEGSAETVPEPDASFDFAISEYGAAIWCDPYVWLPEAARLLKPGGRLVFLGNHPLAMVTTPPNGAASDTTLHRDWFGLHRLDWTQVEIDPGGVEFNLPISGWLALFDATGFDVEQYLELQAPSSATGEKFGTPAEWAKRFPSEQVWKLRRR